MDANEYVSQRLDDQITWYDAKSTQTQRRYKQLRVIEIVVAAIIPLLVGFSEDRPALRLAAGIAAVVVAIAGGLLALNQYQERWVEYRTTCESLRHHKYRFLTAVEPYSNRKEAFRQLVDNVEALISTENTVWASHTRTESEEAPSG